MDFGSVGLSLAPFTVALRKVHTCVIRQEMEMAIHFNFEVQKAGGERKAISLRFA